MRLSGRFAGFRRSMKRAKHNRLKSFHYPVHCEWSLLVQLYLKRSENRQCCTFPDKFWPSNCVSAIGVIPAQRKHKNHEIILSNSPKPNTQIDNKFSDFICVICFAFRSHHHHRHLITVKTNRNDCDLPVWWWWQGWQLTASFIYLRDVMSIFGK